MVCYISFEQSMVQGKIFWSMQQLISLFFALNYDQVLKMKHVSIKLYIKAIS
jgi:hypothetical protein